jgi:hypothetical protein
MAKRVGLEVLSIKTDREVFIERSSQYIVDATVQKVGFTRTPMAKETQPGVPFRVARKAFRMTALPVLNGLAGLAGDGESIHAVLKK